MKKKCGANAPQRLVWCINFSTVYFERGGDVLKQKAIVYDMPGMVEIDVCAHKKIRRGGRVIWGATKESQKRVNMMQRKRYVTRLVNLNFDNRSVMLELHYENGMYPDSMIEAKRDMQNYIRRIKRLFKKAGAELKYIYCTEMGEESGRIHHHMIVSGGVSKEALLKTWKGSRRNYAAYLEFTENGYTDLAVYYAKKGNAEKYERTYTTSQNLVKPEPLPEEDREARAFSRVFTKKNCQNFYEHNYTNEEIGRMFPGYKLCEGWTCNYNPYDHTYYMHMRLLKTNAMIASWATTITYKRGTMGDDYPWDVIKKEDGKMEEHEEGIYSVYQHTEYKEKTEI